MTKRILAAFLAVMMVVGIMPVSVLAAGSNGECVVVTQYTDHSKEHCEKAGVEYTVVPNSTVIPECGQDGYTLYQCACGDYFADDIVPMAPHHTESGEPKTAKVEPTCYATGKVAVYVCDECGDEYFNPDDLLPTDVDDKTGVIAKTQHTFDQVSYPTNSCLDSIQVCENEGCTEQRKNPNAKTAHKWNYADPHAIVKAPTEDEQGEAVFKCDNEGCTQTKTVEVLELAHTHAMTPVAEQKSGEGCVITTVAAHYKCTKCNKLYKDQAGTTETTLEAETTTTNHNWNKNPTIIAPTCTTWGFSYYGCPTCGAKKDFTEIKPLDHTDYKCDTHGREWDNNCDECKDAKKSTGYDKIEASCSVDGKHVWKCGRCGIDKDEKINKTEHNKTKVTVPATCGKAYTYIFYYCTNKNCTDANGVATPLAKTATVDGKLLDLTVEIRDGNVYDLPADHTGFKLIGTPTVTASTETPVHFLVEDKAVQAPNCTDAGKAFWYCAGTNGCNYHDEEILDALGHNYSNTANDSAATCTENAYKVCDRAGCTAGPNGGAYRDEQLGTKGHKKAAEKFKTTLPTCLGGKGYDYYECTANGCTYVFEENETTFVPNRTYEGREDLNLTAKQEFELEHPNFDPADYHEYRKGDCLNYGYWNATCPDCNKTYLVLKEGTGKGHSAPVTVYPEATCTQWKGYEAYTCTNPGCVAPNVPAKVEAPAKGHTMKTHDANAETCLNPGNSKYYECTVCKLFFADVQGNTPIAKDSWIIPAKNHAYQHTPVEVNCTTPGFTHHICNNCKDEYVDGYTKPTGHTKGQNVSKKAYCEVDGYEKFLCAINGCTGDDGIAGTEDDGVYSYQDRPAVGHKNAKGQIITNICTDTVTDRVCKNCNWYTEWKNKATQLEPAPAKAGTVRKDHAVTEVTVAAGCEHYGYKMETCANGCGQKDKVTVLVDPTGHLAPWGQYIKADDMTAINEVDVKPYGEEFLATDPELYTGSITAYTAPTYEALGSVTFYCQNHCGNGGKGIPITRDVIRTGLDFTLELDNAVVAGANTVDGVFRPVDGDVIAVDVYANAYDTDVWGFNFDLHYTAAAMNYLGYVYHAGDVFGTHMVNNIVEDEVKYDVNDVDNDNIKDEILSETKGKNGIIKLSAFTENEIGGKKVDAKVNGSLKVATLYFQVESYYEVSFSGIPEYKSHETTSLYIDDAWMSSTEDGEARCDGQTAGFGIVDMLDTNANGFYNIEDLKNCYKIMTGEVEIKYLASADANKDGIINIDDLVLMNQYLVGSSTILDMYKELTWTSPEGFVAAK